MSEGVLARLSEDRAFASVVLFGHRHPQAESEMHVEMMDMMASADEFIVLEAFREAGKTTKAEEHICLARLTRRRASGWRRSRMSCRRTR